MDIKEKDLHNENTVSEKDRDSGNGNKTKYILCTLLAASAIFAAATAVLVNRDSKDDVIMLTPANDNSAYDMSDDPTDSVVFSSETTAVPISKATTKVKPTESEVSRTQKTEASGEILEIVYSYPADINLADRDILMSISGIGEVTADRIIEYRDSVGVICNMDMLLEVNGIGEATLDLLKEYFYVDEYDYRDMPDDNETEENDEENDYEEPAQTTVKTTTAGTTATKHTTVKATVVTAPPKQRRKVNINTASAEELAEKLLLNEDQAQEVVNIREKISYYSSPNELLLCEGFTDQLVSELWDYIET